MPTPKLSDELCLEAVEALAEHKTQIAAAKALGISRTGLQNRLTHAARRGMAPGHFEHGVAPGYDMGKVTVQRNAQGEVERTWERQSPNAQASLQALESAIDSLCQNAPKERKTKRPKHVNSELLTLYTFTDYHVGALAWHKEGGADWDTGIAEKLGNAAMDALVEGAPRSAHAVVNIQGDFLHYDGLMAVTPTHGHVLDADSRFGRVVDVSINLIRSLVSKALAKHDRVTLLVCEGNHDIASSLWLRKLFGHLYENEPRIDVNDSELPYYAMEWGKTMLGFHHGHMRKNEQLPSLFAAQFREMWGRCPKVAIHTGHRHHKEVKEHPGAEVHQHPTLAARDAHASRGGWWSERKITAITYSREFGEVGTVTITPEMLQY